MKAIRMNRPWYERGGRHALDNRISDLTGFLNVDLSQDSAIDIGCAEGDMIDCLKERFQSIHGMEKSEYLFEKLQNRFRNEPQIQLWNQDIAETELQQDYDYIFLLGVLHYFVDEDARKAVLQKLLKRTRKYLFVRTSFLESRITICSDPHEQESLERKSTRLTTIAEVSAAAGFRWVFVDNAYRGQDEHRLGGLVILRRVHDILEEPALQFCSS